MQHVLQGELEALADDPHFAQRQVAVVELAVVDAALDDVVNELVDLLRRDFFQRTRRALDSVGEHDDASLLELRFRPAVTEALLAHLRDVLLADVHDLATLPRILLLLERAFVKIPHLRSAVMLLDDIDNALVELVFEREINALLHMGHDDQCAHGRGEFAVGILADAHVFGEILGLHELADVVKVGADARHRGIRPDGLGGGFGEVGDDEAVVVGAGCLDGQALEQRVVQIGEIQPGDVGRESKKTFEHGQRAHNQDRSQDAASDCGQAFEADHFQIDVAGHLPDDRAYQTGISLAKNRSHRPRRQTDEKPGTEQAAAAADADGEKDGNEPADEAHHQKHRRINALKNDSAPKTCIRCCVNTVISSKKHRADQRRECVGNQKCSHLMPASPFCPRKNQQNLDRREMNENGAHHQQNARVARKRVRVVDPELRQRDGKNQQPDQKLFRRLRLFPRKDQHRKTRDERGKQQNFYSQTRVHLLQQLALRAPTPGFRRGKALFNEAVFFKDAKHDLSEWADRRHPPPRRIQSIFSRRSLPSPSAPPSPRC